MPITESVKNELAMNKTRAVIQQRGRGTVMSIEAVPQASQYYAAAYCRVSTDSEEQEGSLIEQRNHFLSLIETHPEWTFTDVYYERGISGTKKDNRPELQRLLSDCMSGKVNLILVKSISRFARNTIDCLGMIRKLTQMGIRLIFEKERIDTASVDSEFILTILASLAEDESHSISGNNKWAIQKRFQSGTYKPGTAPYGYDLLGGMLIVNPNEAEVVRRVFHMYLNGAGAKKIADHLNAEGIPTKRMGQDWLGKPNETKWKPLSIQNMLRNYDYIGDALLQQTYHDSTFAVKPNRGELPQYYVEGRHQAIISKEEFTQVQGLFEQRRREHGDGSHSGNQYLYSRKLICGHCGSTMLRSLGRKDTPFRVQWVCTKHHLEQGKCPAKPVLDANITNSFSTLLNKLRYADSLLTGYIKGLEEEWRELHKAELDVIEDKIALVRTNQTYLKMKRGEMNAAEYQRRMNQLIAEEQMHLTGLDRIPCGVSKEALAFQQAVKGHESESAVFERYVERVVCRDRTTYEYHLSCGLCLTERIKEQAANTHQRAQPRSIAGTRTRNRQNEGSEGSPCEMTQAGTGGELLSRAEGSD